jgi:hypothetical protein
MCNKSSLQIAWPNKMQSGKVRRSSDLIPSVSSANFEVCALGKITQNHQVPFPPLQNDL